MDTKTSQLLMGSKERDSFALYSFTDHEELLNYLLKYKLLLVIDWKGEETEHQIGRFLKSRVAILSPETLFDIEGPYAKLKGEINKSKIDTGDSVPFLLKQFQSQLKKVGLSIVLLDLGNDSYYIGLMQQNNIKDLKKQSDPLWKFVAFGTLSGEVLYTINCDCGSMNVWQVKRGEKITDDVCQDCGKQLFDENGISPLPVIRDFI